MKILHVIDQLLAANGGPPRGLATLAVAQAEKGHEVLVMPAQKTTGEQTLNPGSHGKLHVLDAPSSSNSVLYDAAIKRAIRNAARDRDIVHIHGMWRYFLRASASTAREYGIPYIIRPAGSLGRIPRRQKGSIKLLYFRFREKPAFQRAAAIHVCSKKEQEEFQELNLGVHTFIAPQPIRLGLQTCVPDSQGLRGRCPNIKDDRKVILYLGRISAIKRLEVLVEAFIRLNKRFPDWHLVIAGPHEDMEIVRRIQSSIAAAGLQSRLSMPGMVTYELKAACFAAGGIFAQPSLHENFGMSVAEAISFGLPCVVSDGVALADDIAEGGAGIVTTSSVDTFEHALESLMSNSELRQQCSVAAAILSRRYSSDVVVDRLDQEYHRCLDRSLSAAGAGV